MSKLFKLKKWHSLYDAAKAMSVALKESIGASDLLRLALDGHLVMSTHFVNGAYGSPCVPVDLEKIEWKDLPSLDGERTLRMAANGRVFEHEGRFYQVRNSIVNLEDGVWDLPLMGGERIDVEFQYQQMNFGPEPTAVSLEGVFVQSIEGQIYELQSRLELGSSTKGRPFMERENFHPAGALPEDSVLVVRTASIEGFIKQYGGEEGANHSHERTVEEKPLLSRERETLLNIIGVMLELLQTPKSGRDSDAAVIKEMIDNYGDKPGIKERTLQEKFPAAKRSLAAK